MLHASSVPAEEIRGVYRGHLEDGGLDSTRAPPCEFTVVLPSHMPGLTECPLMPKQLKETHHLLEVHPLSTQARHAVAHLFCSSWLCGKKSRRFTWFYYTLVKGPK